ncbi:MAG: hypothetical protein DRJ38_01880 [Thermoprotei archaeon]|nr:MAG: hypothetical protein DRJ38_01880 [Thermoprotei archaeon]
MRKRRALTSIVEEEFAELPFHQIEKPTRGARGARGGKATRFETFVAFIAVLFTIIIAIAMTFGYVSAQSVAMIAFAMLFMSAVLMLGNYLIKKGKLTGNAQIYLWVFGISISLLALYLVQKGIIPLIFGGMLAAQGLAQFEEFISWIAYVIIGLLAVGVIVIALMTPGEEEITAE